MFLRKNHRSFIFKTGTVIFLGLIIIGLAIYTYFHYPPKLNEELGYIRAVQASNGGYVLTFDDADWLFEDGGEGANEPATKTISTFKLATSLYYFLQKNKSYLNAPVAIYLDQNHTVVKVELVDDTH